MDTFAEIRAVVEKKDPDEVVELRAASLKSLCDQWFDLYDAYSRKCADEVRHE